MKMFDLDAVLSATTRFFMLPSGDTPGDAVHSYVSEGFNSSESTALLRLQFPRLMHDAKSMRIKLDDLMANILADWPNRKALFQDFVQRIAKVEGLPAQVPVYSATELIEMVQLGQAIDRQAASPPCEYRIVKMGPQER